MVFPASTRRIDVPIKEKASDLWLRNRKVAKGHGPYTLGEGERACLLVHGIAGSPAQMHPLAQCLARWGFKAHAILLPGHGTHPEDLRGVVWQDWYEAIHNEVCKLRSSHREVTLIGFSIGAALSAYYAEHNPVDRLILLSIPLCPLNDQYPTELMLRIYGVFRKRVTGKPGISRTADGEPFCYVYNWVPTPVLHTMLELIRIVRRRIDRIEAPTLIIQSKNDQVSGARSGPLVYRGISSSHKKLLLLEKSGHNVIMDGEQELVLQEMKRFFHIDSCDRDSASRDRSRMGKKPPYQWKNFVA
jgi:carboxylesterase